MSSLTAASPSFSVEPRWATHKDSRESEVASGKVSGCGSSREEQGRDEDDLPASGEIGKTEHHQQPTPYIENAQPDFKQKSRQLRP
jgi:hypothetical protein